MFKFIKAFIVWLGFTGSLARIAKVSDHTKCVSLNNESCLARPNLINLSSSELHNYSFMVNLERFNGNWNLWGVTFRRI